jgi:ABC-type Fe2+-enterobactin transport system substrate-binding protein
MALPVITSLMSMKTSRSLASQIGYPPVGTAAEELAAEQVRRKNIALVLASHGIDTGKPEDDELSAIARDLIVNYREKVRL